MGMVVEQTAIRTLSCQLVVGAEMEGERAQNMPWGLWSRDWGSLAGRQVTHFFFQLVQVCLGAVVLAGDIWPGWSVKGSADSGCRVGLAGYSVQWVGMVLQHPASNTLTCQLDPGVEIQKSFYAGAECLVSLLFFYLFSCVTQNIIYMQSVSFQYKL